MTRDRVYQLRAMIVKASASLPDADALEAVELFPAWAAGTDYTVGERVRYAEKLYRVVQTHTSQAGWEPPETPALFVEIAKPSEIGVWKQPAGAHDAYNKGAKVHYPDEAGPVYESLIDNNTWSPDAYPAGWRRL